MIFFFFLNVLLAFVVVGFYHSGISLFLLMVFCLNILCFHITIVLRKQWVFFLLRHMAVCSLLYRILQLGIFEFSLLDLSVHAILSENTSYIAFRGFFSYISHIEPLDFPKYSMLFTLFLSFFSPSLWDACPILCLPPFFSPWVSSKHLENPNKQ